jgi:hypothetical protein
MLDTGCWILDAGYWILDTLGTGYWLPDEEFMELKVESS